MGDPFSIAIGTLQIAGQCAQATIALAKYINQVATVDQRIKGFYEDLTKLQTTYESLQQCRSSPQLVAAAKAADHSATHLWTHLATTLQDCENTLVAINHTLAKINKPLGLGAQFRQYFEPPIKQLQEQLHGGELGRHREKLRMFNTSMALPMQMINITLQLDQRVLSEQNQRRLEARLVTMQNTINSLHANIADLKQPRMLTRSETMTTGTLVGEADTEKEVCDHMEKFAGRASHFLSSASNAAASSRSAASTIHPEGLGLIAKGTSEAGKPLTFRERREINAWVPTLHEDSNASVNESEDTPSPSTEHDQHSTDDEDFDLELVVTYFQNGQADLSQPDAVDFAAAEENFVEALKLLQANNFGDRIAFQAADIVLLLTHCYVEQSKFDEAIEMLLPLTEDDVHIDSPDDPTSKGKAPMPQRSKRQPDHGRVLAAQHSLGNVYLQKGDIANAEKYGLSAFMGRRKLFGKDREKTIESAQLVVDIYTANGERAKARAYSKHLTPEADRSRRPSEPASRTLTTTHMAPQIHPVVSRKAIPTLDRSPTNDSVLPPSLPSPPQPATIPLHRAPNDLHLATGHVGSTQMSSPISSRQRPSIFDDATSAYSSITRSSIQRRSSVTPRSYLKPRFDAIKITAMTAKDKACVSAHHILTGYDPEPSKILIQRWDDIKRNVKKHGAERGLAATGSGYAPIHFFCELKEEAVTEVELLIEEGVDLMAVRYRAGYGKQEPMTPLQLAIEKNHQVIAVMSIDALHAANIPMADLMALKDREEFSPLLAACRRGQIDTVTRFLQYGAGVFCGFPKAWRGNSLLHDACSRCDVDMVNLLISIQNNRRPRHDIGTINQQDQFGCTPFMYAVISKNIPDQSHRDRKLRGRYQCVEMLLRFAGDDLEAILGTRDAKGMDVMGHAVDEGNSQLLELFENYGISDKSLDVAVY